MKPPIGDRLFRLLLGAYPVPFRRRFGAEMADAYRRRVGQAGQHGRLAAAGLATWLCLDAVASGLAERRHAFFARRAERRGRRQLEPSRSETMSWSSCAADARLAVRRLRQAPVFALVTIATLGLGIGANSAIFSVAHSVLLSPLPYAAPGDLVAIWSDNTAQQEPRNPVSPANLEAFSREAPSFARIEATYSFLLTAQADLPGGREPVTWAGVTPGLFDLLGRPPLHGRALQPGDDTAIVLSHRLWTRAFAADPTVVGRTLTIGDAHALTIVGVMPEDFVFPYRTMLGASGFGAATAPDLWQLIPMTTGRMVGPDGQPNRQVHFLALIGRLRPGATLGQARAELDAIARRRAAEFPDSNTGWRATALPLHDQVVGDVRPVVLLLLGGVGLLLLMMCINVANVLLARAAGKQRDLAVRAALGASKGRLVQQALIESGVVAVAGGLAGVAVLAMSIRAIVALAPADLPRLDETRIDATVLAFAILLSAAAALIVGALPALASARVRIAALQESSRATSSLARQRARTGLVAAELALATLLMIGAGLTLRSFVSVLAVDPGFQAEGLLTFQQNVPARAATPGAQVTFLEDLMAQLAAIPGVVRVGGTTRIPLGSSQVTTMLSVEGREVPPGGLPEVDMRRAVGDYFAAMGMPVERGRVFEAGDRSASIGLAVVNAALAARVFPGEDPVGRRVRMGPNPNATPLTIIGVVGDIRHSSLEAEPRPEIYISHFQGPPVSPFFVVRTTGDAAALGADVRRVATSLGADPPYHVRTMSQLRSEAVALRRFTMLLAAIFGALAIVLAAVGTYGVVALVVAERTNEVGVRVAMGATPASIVGMLLGYAVRVGAVGIALGVAAGLALARLARSVLYGISPADPVTFIGVGVGLLTIAMLAALVPARRAMRISPLDALRAKGF